MSIRQNSSTRNFFSFLGNALSISNVVTWNQNGMDKETLRKAETHAKPEMSTAEYFDFLADTLSISRVVS